MIKQMPSIQNIFLSARKEGRRALIGFLTVGDPSPKYTPRLCKALIDGGVDILELGIPFSDPIADGPTIQAADVRALGSGTTTETCLNIARSVKRDHGSNVPMAFLTYYNPIFRMGLESFMSKASECVDGLIVPDLPALGSAEFADYKRLALKNGLSTILLAAPTTNTDRLKMILHETTGFLYLISLLGVTGARKSIASINLNFIKGVCRLANGSVPVAVGFGISNPDQVQTVLKKTGADGVIVGSAFVNIVANNMQDIDSAAEKLKRFTHSLRDATYL